MTTTKTTTHSPSPHDLLDDVLSEAVRLTTNGEFDSARPGQSKLSHRVLDTMLNATSVEHSGPKHLIGKAPTGVGKSLAYLAPAMLVAALRGERTVVSTESKALQAQLVTKDAPVVSAAVETVFQRRGLTVQMPLTCAVLKGWANYVCTTSFVHTMAELTGNETLDLHDARMMAHFARDITDATGKIPGPKAFAAYPKVPQTLRSGVADVDGTKISDARIFADLLSWAGDNAGSATANRDEFDENPAAMWSLVSTDSSSCLGKNCPFARECSPNIARRDVGNAAVAVTNHATAAIQAAKGYATVLGNSRSGVFDHVVFDECHVLPDAVRAAGATEINAMRLLVLRKRLNKVIAPGAELDRFSSDTDGLADELDRTLSRAATPGRTVELSEGDDPLTDLRDVLDTWADNALRLMPGGLDPSSSLFQKVRSVESAFVSFRETLKESEASRAGFARWLEQPYRRTSMFSEATLKTSPVDVSLPLRSSIYITPVPQMLSDLTGERVPDFERIAEHRWTASMFDGSPAYELSVTMVSATLANNFGYEVGMGVGIESFETPFDAAYAGSALFVPSGSDSSVLNGTGGMTQYNKYKLDPTKHAEWAASAIVDLVAANGGSALVLSTNATNGKAYAQALRSSPMITSRVLTQWDGNKDKSVREWRDDPSSIMVGTKSLMTGVDAPGQTCSLVIIDRIPRAPMNPVDDARVAMMMQNASMSKFDADRRVYAEDAALREAQAVGRLIRSVNDSGMVAILDPRLSPNNAATYGAAVYRTYFAPLDAFGTKLYAMNDATQWLKTHRSANPI